jgi:hypothetical protein
MPQRRIWRAGDNVYLREEDEITGEDRIRRFWVTPGSDGTGYVWEHDPNAEVQRRQVCDGLARLGSTLRSTHDGLLRLIRRQWRAVQAAERRERRRYS